jgi:hypothetical protein
VHLKALLLAGPLNAIGTVPSKKFNLQFVVMQQEPSPLHSSGHTSVRITAFTVSVPAIFAAEEAFKNIYKETIAIGEPFQQLLAIKTCKDGAPLLPPAVML